VPYIYSINAAASSSSIPLVQPLYWNFPSRDVAYQFPNQYYFGPSLVVAPIVSRRDNRTNLANVKVWVPPGRHVDILTGSVYDGDREVDMYRPLQRIPILALQGSIIPLDKELVPANGCANPAAFEVLVVVGCDGKFSILEDSRDDRESQKTKENERSIPIEYNQADGRVTLVGHGREWSFRFISLRTALSNIRVLIDGAVSTEACSIQTIHHPPSVAVTLPAVLSAESVIAIEIGANPQLAILDYTRTMKSLLVDYQIDIKLKDKIWEVVYKPQPIAVKIGGLLALGLEEALFGPLMELMLSDSRSEYGGCLV
jgi:hypothetical protein